MQRVCSYLTEFLLWKVVDVDDNIQHHWHFVKSTFTGTTLFWWEKYGDKQEHSWNANLDLVSQISAVNSCKSLCSISHFASWAKCEIDSEISTPTVR